MPTIKPFRAFRPASEYASQVYITHENAGSTEKSRDILINNPYSLLHITHGDIIMDTTSEDEIRENCHNKFNELVLDGILIQDDAPYFYIYRLSLANHSQTGLVARVDIDDYIRGHVKRHELTRSEKIDRQVDILKRVGGCIEPILLAYNSHSEAQRMIMDWAYSHDALYDFLDDGGVHHEIWAITDKDLIEKLESVASSIDSFYICDGHHRMEAASEYYKANPENENNRYFLAAIFPSDEMLILDYNRAVKDLNEMSSKEFIKALNNHEFKTEVIGSSPAYPEAAGEYTMVMNDIWYRLKYTGTRNVSDPVEELDVSILQRKVMDEILGIKDPQHDNRLVFISGTRGLTALQTATQKNMAVAFALFAPTMKEIMNVSDAGKTMPPKSTCFEPKMAGGFLVYKL